MRSARWASGRSPGWRRIAASWSRSGWSRNGGAAAETLDAIVAIAAERDVLQIELNVHLGNERAIRFYRSHGFTAFGRLPRGHRVGTDFIDDLLMVRMPDA